MNDEENKLSTVNPRYNAPRITNFGYTNLLELAETSLRYNELKFVISEDTELLEL
ncbi:Hypothetical protein FKW44_016260, partial [Caligus rogercresseyi]